MVKLLALHRLLYSSYEPPGIVKLPLFILQDFHSHNSPVICYNNLPNHANNLAETCQSPPYNMIIPSPHSLPSLPLHSRSSPLWPPCGLTFLLKGEMQAGRAGKETQRQEKRRIKRSIDLPAPYTDTSRRHALHYLTENGLCKMSIILQTIIPYFALLLFLY